MAPALTSNSFRITSHAYSRPSKPAYIVSAKQNTAKQQNGEVSTKEKKFFFDFGQIPDAKSLIPVVTAPSPGSLFGNRRRKDPKTVFVAGATGQAGIRIAQTLLQKGFAVRAGVPDLAAAQELARLAAAYKIISPEESKRLNAVESTFSNSESIAKAIGPAAKVVVTIAAGENGPAGEVTTDDALQVILAAQLAGVGHVAVIYDSSSLPSVLGSSTYNVLDGITTFFSNIFSRSQSLTLSEFLAKLAETDVTYTLIKASISDDYSDEIRSYPLVFSNEGSAIDESKVSKSQIASLVADVFSNTSVAENKVVVVSTSPSASPKPISELFSAIPEDGRRKAYAEAAAQAKAAEEALVASEKARKASETAKKLEEVKKPSEQKGLVASFTEEAQERAQAAGSSLEGLLGRAKNIGGDLSWEKFSSQIATAVSQKQDDDEPRVQLATARGRVKAFNLAPRKAVVRPPARKPNPKQPEPKPEVNRVFGGLFKQETIYIDDD